MWEWKGVCEYNEDENYHFVNRLHDLQHLIVTNLSIPIDIIQLKRPIQFIFHLPAARDTQRADELFEVDAAGLVLVEDIEDVVGEGGRVAKGEELAVDFLEFGFCEHAGWAVFEEACVFEGGADG